jgi:hypothetical protein
MNKSIELNIIYKECYEKCEYEILKYEDPLLHNCSKAGGTTCHIKGMALVFYLLFGSYWNI